MGGVLLKINSQQLQKPLALRTLNDKSAIRGLLVQDRQHLDSVQTTMASSREFCFVLRRRKTDGTMNYSSSSRCR